MMMLETLKKSKLRLDCLRRHIRMEVDEAATARV
jgi:hypothetical protein